MYTVRQHIPYEPPEENYFEDKKEAESYIIYILQSRQGLYLDDFSLYETPKEICIESLRVYQR